MPVTYGAPSALAALLAATDMGQSPWPTAPTVYVALDPEIGTALMPNPVTIPSTLLLQGTPPLKLPSGTSGYVLTSDTNGNLTLQPAAGGAPSGPAGGDLGGNYPNPTVLSVADVTTGTLGIGNGGTGAATRQAAINALAGGVTAKNYLRGNGSNILLTGIPLSDIAGQVSSSAVFHLSNPTGTSGTSLLMMGLGSSTNQTSPAVFTPTGSGIVKVKLIVYGQNPTTLSAMTVGARWGTGTAPTNGTSAAAYTSGFGASFTADPAVRPSSLTSQAPAVFEDRLSGLTLGTQIWVDACLAAVTATDLCQLVGCVVMFEELFG